MTQLRIEHVANATRNLMDVSDVAREAGFQCPVAVSIPVYNAYVALPPMGPVPAFGDMQRQVRLRLWNLLGACRDAINAQRDDALTLLEFKVYTRRAGLRAFARRTGYVRLRVGVVESGEGLLIESAPPGERKRRSRSSNTDKASVLNF